MHSQCRTLTTSVIVTNKKTIADNINYNYLNYNYSYRSTICVYVTTYTPVQYISPSIKKREMFRKQFSSFNHMHEIEVELEIDRGRKLRASFMF